MKNSTRTAPRRIGARIAKAAAVAIVASLAFAGCSSQPTSGPNTVTLWYAPDDPGVKAQKEWAKFNVDPFEKLYPKVTVNAVLVPSQNLEQKQKVALAAGSGPDIITSAGSATAIPYATAGYLADLSDAAAANDWKSRILPWALDMGYVDGKLVALPTSYETMVVYYNKTLFEKNGWELPTDRDSLVALAKTMQAKGIIPFAAGNASYPGASEWLVSTYLNQVAGPAKIHAALSGEVPFTDPSIVASIQMMKDDFDKGWYAGGVKQYFTTQDPQKYAQLADGKAAMMVSGSWEVGALNDDFGTKGNTNEWAWGPLPPLADGVTSNIHPLSVGGTISVNAHSKAIKASTNYVSWLFSDTKNMWAAVEAGSFAPFPISYSPSDVPSGVDPRYAAQYQAINDASVKGNVGYVTWTSFGSKSEAYVLDNVDKVINGDMSAQAFCAGIDAAFQKDKAAGLVPPLFSTGG